MSSDASLVQAELEKYGSDSQVSQTENRKGRSDLPLEYSRGRAAMDSLSGVDQCLPNLTLDAAVPSDSNVIPESIFFNWSLLRLSGLSDGAFGQLTMTASNRLVESGDQSPLNRITLTAFLEFWNKIRLYAAEPDIAVSPKGNVQIEWEKDGENFIVLEFRPDNAIFFSLWQKDNPTEGVRSREQVDEFIRILGIMDENPLSWTYATQ
ncbi:MAG: hypothetical protein O2967_19955 [Proteobacteria bacterium]|nr:hypothetical protein [Pseudomonadota bacterium]